MSWCGIRTSRSSRDCCASSSSSSSESSILKPAAVAGRCFCFLFFFVCRVTSGVERSLIATPPCGDFRQSPLSAWWRLTDRLLMSKKRPQNTRRSRATAPADFEPSEGLGLGRGWGWVWADVRGKKLTRRFARVCLQGGVAIRGTPQLSFMFCDGEVLSLGSGSDTCFFGQLVSVGNESGRKCKDRWGVCT